MTITSTWSRGASTWVCASAGYRPANTLRGGWRPTAGTCARPLPIWRGAVTRKTSPTWPQHACLHFSPLLEEDRWQLSQGARQVKVPIVPAVRADNAEALRQVALGGQGIALLADFLVDDDLKAGRLVRVLPQWAGADSWVFAVYPHARFLPLKTRVFVDFLVERLGR